MATDSLYHLSLDDNDLDALTLHIEKLSKVSTSEDNSHAMLFRILAQNIDMSLHLSIASETTLQYYKLISDIEDLLSFSPSLFGDSKNHIKRLKDKVATAKKKFLDAFNYRIQKSEH